jgi:hypothetical protein
MGRSRVFDFLSGLFFFYYLYLYYLRPTSQRKPRLHWRPGIG